MDKPEHSKSDCLDKVRKIKMTRSEKLALALKRNIKLRKKKKTKKV